MLSTPVTLEKLRHLTSFHSANASTFYAISQARVNTQMALWKTHLPTVKPFYAVKCNPDPWLMTWLYNKGAGFDCASVREVNAAKQINPSVDIVFANPCKKRDEIIQSYASGVNTTVVDSYEEIDKLNEIGWNQKSLIRIRVDDKGSMMPFSAKFGIDPSEVLSLGKYARLKGQNISGVSFHVGSGCKDPRQYGTAIQQTIKAMNDLKQVGHEPTTIDIGGGFMDGFEEAAKIINTNKAYTLIAEPGRFLAASCQDLFVRVIGKKPGKPNQWIYTLDESLYGQFSCIPFDHAKPKWIRVRDKDEPRRKMTSAVLYGRTCDSVDFIASAHTEELMEGDWLWFPNMGAYTTVTSTEFNGFPKPPATVIQSHDHLQLPDPKHFDEWPQEMRYASAVKVPE